MPHGNAKSPAAYLAAVAPERRAELAKVRRVIRNRLPRGYREAAAWGAITYEVPLRAYPDTYNGKPLCYIGLAAHKNHLALYLMNVYGNPALLKKLKDGFRKAGKKLDMGKSCLRFRKAEDLPLDVIGDIVASTTVPRYIELAEASRRR